MNNLKNLWIPAVLVFCFMQSSCKKTESPDANQIDNLKLKNEVNVSPNLVPGATFKVVGYMPSWAGAVSQIQFSKLTHINYAFILPNSTGGLQPLDNPSKLQSLVSSGHAANVKVLIAVGGWNNGND